MSKAEAIHQLYTTCKDLNFDETFEIVKNAEDEEEKDFIRVISDFILQRKQKKVVSEKRF